jgi:hypothetical protein
MPTIEGVAMDLYTGQRVMSVEPTKLLEIRSIPGMLPRLWERRIIFVANLLSLFFGNEEEAGVLREQVGPLETYGGRLIPILDLLYHGSGGNLLVLERAPTPELLLYFQRDLRLCLPEIEVLPRSCYRLLRGENPRGRSELRPFLDRLQQHQATWMDGFVTDTALEHLAEVLGKRTICTRLASRRGNNKLGLHQHLAQAGLPVFDTRLAGQPSEVKVCLESLREQGYAQAVIKSQIGASGIGLLRVNTTRPGHIPAYLFFEGPCLVQGWLDNSLPGVRFIGSPSVQLFLDDSTLSLYDLTEQILSAESVHEGNVAPPPYLDREPDARTELFRQAEVAGRWLWAQGYRGTASVDFHFVERSGRREVRICEINARVTGATYPSLLARRFLPDGAWLMRNLRLAEPSDGGALIKTLDQAGLLFRPGQPGSVLPINFNTDGAGCVIKGQFLCLCKTAGQAAGLLDKARQILPMKGEFDRD